MTRAGEPSHRIPQPRVLMDGLAYIESPRWHDGRLWFAHWGAGEVVAVDLDGRSEVITHGPPHRNAAKPGHGLGWSIDWTTDGQLLMTGKELMRVQPDGSLVRHADLSAFTDFGWNEIVVDGRGNVYVNSIRFGLIAGQTAAPGIIALVRPDGSTQLVAEDLALPNGMVITPDGSTLVVSESMAGRLTAFDIDDRGSLANRRVWAEGDLGPDGICMDTDGAVWVQTADAPAGAIVRMREGGEILDRIACDQAIFAATLGGPDGDTLFLMTNDWRGIEHVDEALAARNGRILTVHAPAAGAGRP